jgi:hypothetical protein
MTPRKKWRLRLVPAFDYEPEPSMKHAYGRVDDFRRMYANGTGRIHHIDVEVNDGSGWALYEAITFPERAE